MPFVWVLLFWSVGLTLIDFVIVVLVERIWGAEAVEAVTLLHLGANLNEGVVVISILIGHHVLVFVWVLLFWSIGLALIDFIIVILVERVWGAEAVEAVALLHLGALGSP